MESPCRLPSLSSLNFHSSLGLDYFFVQVILKVEISAEFHDLSTFYISASLASIARAGLEWGSPGGASPPTAAAAGNWGRDWASQELPLNPLGEGNLQTHLSGLFSSFGTPAKMLQPGVVLHLRCVHISWRKEAALKWLLCSKMLLANCCEHGKETRVLRALGIIEIFKYYVWWCL